MLLNDALALANVGQLGFDKVLSLAMYAAEERYIPAWTNLYNGARDINKLLYNTSDFDPFQVRYRLPILFSFPLFYIIDDCYKNPIFRCILMFLSDPLYFVLLNLLKHYFQWKEMSRLHSPIVWM